MTHFIEIKDDKKNQNLSALDLPLSIVLLENKKDKDEIFIYIEKISAIKSLTETGSEGTIIAYLAEDDDHLFLQPEAVRVDIFHNDELIKKSVWIKSGDQLAVENKIISFKISGDKIKIIVFNKPDISSPLSETIHIKKPDLSFYENSKISGSETPKQSRTFPEKSHHNIDVSDKHRLIKKSIVIISLLVLIILAGFILFAQSVNFKVEPRADRVDVNGILPAVQLGQNYIMLSGQYELNIKKTGYISIDELIEVNSENHHFNYQLKEKPGLVKFNLLPEANNKIYIDNVIMAKTDKEWYEIEPGKHTLKIENERYKTLKETINIKGQKLKQQYTFELQPNWGYVQLTTHPEKAKITITPLDNNQLQKIPGRTGLSSPLNVELIAGAYKLEVSLKKYRTWSKKILIKAQRTEDLGSIKLQPQPAKVKFITQPEQSLLQIDGEYVGKTPLTVELEAFKQHSYSISYTGFNSYKSSLTTEAAEQKTVNIKLKARSSMVFISTAPKDSKLYIDGKRQIKSSGYFKLSEKTQHVISVMADGYESQSIIINTGRHAENLSINLAKKTDINKLKQTQNKFQKKQKSGRKTSTQVKKLTHRNNQKTKINYSENKNYTNSNGQKMILIEPKKFVMGSARNEIGRRSNESNRTVELKYLYYMSEKEVTNNQFRQYKASHNSGMSLGQSLDRGSQPVVNISWQEAAGFANWLSKKEGLTPFYKEVKGKLEAKQLKPGINGYRLPYEAEWSYAARGEKQLKYPWKGSFPPPDMSGNFADESVRGKLAQYIESYNDQHIVSAPVASYHKNSLGFYDMGGNVSEWCQDYYTVNSSFGINRKKIDINPTGKQYGVHRVVRDASWRDASITELRLSYRNYSKKKANDIGFRLARYQK